MARRSPWTPVFDPEVAQGGISPGNSPKTVSLEVVSVAAVGLVPAVTVTRGKLVLLASAVAATASTPSVSMSAGSTVSPASAVDATATVPTVTVSAT